MGVTIVLTGILVVLVIMLYSMCVLASRADERAERMFEKWMKEREKDNDNDKEI